MIIESINQDLFLYLPGDYSRLSTGTRTGIVIYRHRPDPLQVESQPRRLPPWSYRRPGRVPARFPSRFVPVSMAEPGKGLVEPLPDSLRA